MSWRKEHREHPWTTTSQAKRIAHDHHETKESKSHERKEHSRSHKQSVKRVGLFHQKVPLQYTPEFLGKMKTTEAKAVRI